jgi:hypothetical protein
MSKVYYPSSIAAQGALPLITVAHGHGFVYPQYSVIATHIASYGYIVMTHATDTGPGTQAVSNSILEHTLALIAFQGIVGGGVLDGHIDASRIAWTGHSRGGEGIVLAYNRLLDGEFSQPYYNAGDIVLLSAMSPTNNEYDRLVPLDPKNVAYSLWLVSADEDVRNHPLEEPTMSPVFWSRSTGAKQIISIYGSDHAAYIDANEPSEEHGIPCTLSHEAEMRIIKGYFVPLLKRYTDASVPAKDFLWRQWENFRPPECVNTPETLHRRI